MSHPWWSTSLHNTCTRVICRECMKLELKDRSKPCKVEKHHTIRLEYLRSIFLNATSDNAHIDRNVSYEPSMISSFWWWGPSRICSMDHKTTSILPLTWCPISSLVFYQSGGWSSKKLRWDCSVSTLLSDQKSWMTSSRKDQSKASLQREWRISSIPITKPRQWNSNCSSLSCFHRRLDRSQVICHCKTW